MVYCIYSRARNGKSFGDGEFLTLNHSTAKHLVEMWDAATDDYDYAVKSIRTATPSQVTLWNKKEDEVLHEFGVFYMPIGRLRLDKFSARFEKIAKNIVSGMVLGFEERL